MGSYAPYNNVLSSPESVLSEPICIVHSRWRPPNEGSCFLCNHDSCLEQLVSVATQIAAATGRAYANIPRPTGVRGM